MPKGVGYANKGSSKRGMTPKGKKGTVSGRTPNASKRGGKPPTRSGRRK